MSQAVRKTVPVSDLVALGQYIRRIREQKQLTLQEVQRRGGPAPSWQSNLENGTMVDEPKPSTLKKLAQGLGVSYDEIQRAMGDLPSTGSDRQPGVTGEGKVTETPKPWPLHDLSQPSMGENEVTRGIEDTKSNQIMEASPSAAGKGSGIPEDSLRGSTPAQPPLPPYLERVDWTSGPILRLPVFEISCGEPIILPDHPELIEKWPRDLVGDVDAKMIVRGTSMIGLGYMPGDELFVKMLDGDVPRHGDEVVAEVNGGATCKLYQEGPQGPFLMGVAEPGVAPMIIWVTPEVRIVGIVEGVYKRRRGKGGR